MKIISFAWTTPAFKARRKSCTRRDWNDRYAAQFHPGDLCQAWDKSPRYGGKCIGTIRIGSVVKERYCDAPSHDWIAEGFDYLTEIGATCNLMEPRDLWDQWLDDGRQCWVARFEIVDVFDDASFS